jgi:16S rRNA C967 or C1407 C5-methylase (RsmB/RsmF family)
MEPEEGEEVVLRFLRETAGFRPVDARQALPPQCSELVDERGFLRTSPLDDGMDGFFGALLARSR